MATRRHPASWVVLTYVADEILPMPCFLSKNHAGTCCSGTANINGKRPMITKGKPKTKRINLAYFDPDRIIAISREQRRPLGNRTKGFT
ncbi:MAG: hypothetical protein ACLS9G_00050 [Akkermansia sp.]